MGSKPRRIAVLGGGLSAMTSVYTLMQEPNWEEKYDITVYQLGWRIGGKGASGVNPEIGYRIEEHGLHLWMGFYENAFKMIKDVYKNLDRPKDAPMSTFEKAFSKQDYFIFTENVNNKWVDWKVPFPALPGKVGDGQLPSVEEILEAVSDFIIHHIVGWLEDHLSHIKNKSWLQKIVDFFIKLFGGKSDAEVQKIKDRFFHHLEEELDALDDEIIARIQPLFSKVVKRMTEKLKNDEDVSDVLESWRKIKNWIWDLLGDLVEENDTARRAWLAVDFGTTLFTGMLKDKVLTVQDGKLHFDFEVINDIDYGDWLQKHGASEEHTVGSPIVRAMYDGPFAFLKGNPHTPNVEAGTILNIFLRLGFTCKENIVWRMDAGMGDTIFGPIYEDLVRKKPDMFKFFHAVRDITLTEDNSAIDKVVIGKQVTLKEDNYNPLVNVKGLDCWPSRPMYDQIDDKEAKELQDRNINLESSWTDWEDRDTIILNKDEDFDEVIFGFSLATIPHVASELIDANDDWYTMLQKMRTVQTQAYQYWFNKDAKGLGIEEDKLQSTYVEPVDTFCAMNQVLDKEDWPKEYDPKYVAYSCGVFQDAEYIPPFNVHDFPEKEQERVKENLKEYIDKYLQHLIPNLYNEKGEFDWDALVDLQNGKGEERISSIYTRVNIDPSERYVLSVVDSSKYRLKTNQTGFSNLYVTGDWIQNGMNAGFVEGAVISGLLTAKALSDQPDNIEIITDNWTIRSLEKELEID
ncbi:NAD(P)-binding protein [Flammeovirga yaeyamensis]|uniref:NAD(P)-binding protein n=1 Tax=Flammeovirga yaeyamensis TaxID=367791 RepID=A0AAX1N3M4_9BACT|nr:NAD(P)-binding protein [Flammeovirga yaeyamensis]MBB3699595.1 uncharacterized protein with NAD-binding domain and iron-sulfur cluster [Flammeovirga yaeyamensis]NMF36832.1 NAD(P)-binding protein [Flammeovirga yaeyamensis]QWG02129.1 NAD(P)-binding protein [Flammeovirga yaeyamensis]